MAFISSSTVLNSHSLLCSSLTQDLHGFSRNIATSNSIRESSQLQVWAAGGKSMPPRQGRGYNSRKAAAEGIRKRMSNRDLDQAGWVQVAEKGDLIEGKNKAIIHENNGYVMVQRGSLIYTVKANCTSCQFPMIDGKVEVVGEGDDLTIECPLCHTKFSMVDGDVKDFCPKDGALQWVIGTIKERASPVAANVYPTRMSNSGRIYVKFIGI
ncbi:hypothetical protein R1sor_002866 [Riccia sorocarpa]|uniref:Rieske-like [2Fe-2S] domain-containing protein n=1 Tax=Riccia sorocarpa TaxID=122646 RepID=A0ABD3H640_9MARC